jgi:uncharacterized protein GlcG (DUF336 family)
MFNTVRHSSSFDGIVIDDRNERPLTIALATIIMVWAAAGAVIGAAGASGDTSDNDEAALLAAIAEAGLKS